MIEALLERQDVQINEMRGGEYFGFGELSSTRQVVKTADLSTFHAQLFCYRLTAIGTAL